MPPPVAAETPPAHIEWELAKNGHRTICTTRTFDSHSTLVLSIDQSPVITERVEADRSLGARLDFWRLALTNAGWRPEAAISLRSKQDRRCEPRTAVSGSRS